MRASDASPKIDSVYNIKYAVITHRWGEKKVLEKNGVRYLKELFNVEPNVTAQDKDHGGPQNAEEFLSTIRNILENLNGAHLALAIEFNYGDSAGDGQIIKDIINLLKEFGCNPLFITLNGNGDCFKPHAKNEAANLLRSHGFRVIENLTSETLAVQQAKKAQRKKLSQKPKLKKDTSVVKKVEDDKESKQENEYQAEPKPDVSDIPVKSQVKNSEAEPTPGMDSEPSVEKKTDSTQKDTKPKQDVAIQEELKSVETIKPAKANVEDLETEFKQEKIEPKSVRKSETSVEMAQSMNPDDLKLPGNIKLGYPPGHLDLSGLPSPKSLSPHSLSSSSTPLSFSGDSSASSSILSSPRTPLPSPRLGLMIDTFRQDTSRRNVKKDIQVDFSQLSMFSHFAQRKRDFDPLEKATSPKPDRP